MCAVEIWTDALALQVAIEGCCHGELDAIYASLARAEREKAVKVDLLLICGDFQVRAFPSPGSQVGAAAVLLRRPEADPSAAPAHTRASLLQALRNEHDFESLAVPLKFRNLGSFHSYYSGEKVAPMLTIIIGGNHEASNYMWELCVPDSTLELDACGPLPRG